MWREIRLRSKNVGKPAQLGVEDDERDIRHKVQQVATTTTDGDRRDKEKHRITIRRNGQVENADPDSEHGERKSGRQRDLPRIGISAWWAPTLAALVAALLALGARVAFWGAPLTADEGGYAQIARL